MELNIAKEVAAMQRMTTKQLRVKYAEVFGDGTNANNRTWLIRRIAWRLQSLAEGELSERARGRAAELACDADLRLNPPTLKIAAQPANSPETRTITRDEGFAADDRLPPPGRILNRKYNPESGDDVFRSSCESRQHRRAAIDHHNTCMELLVRKSVRRR